MGKERKIKVLAGCKTNGWTDFKPGNICRDPECPSCTTFTKLFKEESSEKIEEYLGEKLTIEILNEWVEQIFNEKEKN
jgi:hypothetical protein